MNSTVAEFNSVLEELGFTLSDGDSTACAVRIAQKDDISFTLTRGKDSTQDIVSQLVIKVEVTNREGIQY